MQFFNIQTNFSDFNAQGLIKDALLFYEGEHKDSRQKTWVVPPQQIQAIVENTNDFLQSGTIHLFKDHNKTHDAIVGEIVSHVEARPIDKEDIKRNPKLGKLQGRLGIFASGVRIVDPSTAQKIAAGVGKSVSCGIDFGKNLIRELSVVGIPALEGAGFFSQGDLMKRSNLGIPTSIRELQTSRVDMEQYRQEGHELLDDLYDVIQNINSVSYEELGAVPDKNSLYINALNEFVEMLQEALPMEMNQLQQDYQPFSYYEDMAEFETPDLERMIEIRRRINNL